MTTISTAPVAVPTTQDAALGAILGALAGDAAGAVLEFLDHTPAPPEVRRAMSFPGGGVWGVAPGQITDDGELTLCLLHALAEHREFSLDRVAGWYGRWFNSHPFDIGNATAAGLEPARDLAHGSTQGLARQMQLAALRASPGSKANGSLMRCSPLGVWGHHLDDDALVAIARADSSLTHPNPACGDSVAAYTLAIAQLVHVPGDREGAFARAQAWAERDACEEVRAWLSAAARDERTDFTFHAGFVKHGFLEAFRQLKRGASWETAVRETLLGGGDTDTNACIVGGMVGAAEGVGRIPVGARAAVEGCETERGRERPKWLHPRQASALLGPTE